MIQPEHISPPKWPLKILRFFVKKEYLEEIEGDMEEVFQDNLKFSSIGKARKLYTSEIIKLMCPILIRKLEGTYHLNYYGMFKNYLKTSFRSLKRNPLFSGINVVGLAISMAVGILMIAVLSDLYSFDEFHEKKDSIYRVTSIHQSDEGINNFATSSVYIGRQIREQIPGVDDVLILRRDMTAEVVFDEDRIGLKGFWASSSFFDVFTFKLIKGNPSNVLNNPDAIVLTETVAKKLFKDADPIGRTVEVDRNDFFQTAIVTGIVEDPPINSHLQFDCLVSLGMLDKTVDGEKMNFMTQWHSIWNSYVYLVLNDHAVLDQVQQTMDQIMVANNDLSGRTGESIMHSVQSLSAIVPSEDFYNEAGPTFLKNRVNMMLLLTFVVVLSACFNYTNLSLARALRRSKEVAIRRVTGASKIQVFSQFIIESILLSLFALSVALILFFLIKPEFLNLPNDTSNGYKMLLLDFDFQLLLYVILFAISIGFIAGFTPSMFLSKLKEKAVFRDASKAKLFGGTYISRALVVFQFTLSIGLLMFAMIVHNQYKFALNYDLGYDTENIAQIKIRGKYAYALENEVREIPQVLGASKSSRVLGVGSFWGQLVKSENRQDSTEFAVNHVDQEYLQLLDFEFLAGQSFKSNAVSGKKPSHIVVNEKLIEELNMGPVEESIGKSIWYYNNKLQITGVVKNFVNQSLNAKVRPFGFVQPEKEAHFRILNVKLRSENMLSTIDQLEDIYNELDPVHPFEISFYDERIARTYEQHKTTYTIISFLAFLAISISTLGLLGMAVFTTESRMKEVSIRKVLGANIQNLTMLLSGSFLTMIVISGIIAIPITIYYINENILNEFVYHIGIGWVEVLSGFAIVFVIGVLTISWQIRQAVVQNPADLLRDE